MLRTWTIEHFFIFMAGVEWRGLLPFNERGKMEVETEMTTMGYGTPGDFPGYPLVLPMSCLLSCDVFPRPVAGCRSSRIELD